MRLAQKVRWLWVCCGLCAVAAAAPLAPLPQQLDYHQAKAQLGLRLFVDPKLSADGRVACVSCHLLDAGGAESKTVSTGVFQRQGRMNAPSVFNAAFNFRQFWNGRALDLQEQALGPLHSRLEMDMTEDAIEAYLNAQPYYRQAFEAIYGQGPAGVDQLTDVIAEFQKALITPNARFDRFLRGEIELSAAEQAGYLLFKSVGCVTCHNGINIGGNSYQYLGAVHPVEHHPEHGDLYQRTGREFDKNRFKVPSLRNVALTAPYLHDGRAATLGEALDTMAYHNLGFRLDPDQQASLVAFLNALTGETPRILTEP